MVGDPVQGQSAWAFTQSISGILIALMSPFLGAMADAGGRRKPYIFFFQVLLALGCCACGGLSQPPDLASRSAGRSSWRRSAPRCRSCSTTPSCPTSCGPSAWAGCRLRLGPGLCRLADRARRRAGGLRFDAAAFADPSHELERLIGPASALWLASS
jgi:UMF1 family MFS transporter